VPRERAEVCRALAERRHRYGEHGQPVVEILAEAPRAHGPPQIPMRGRDDAHVDAAFAVRAERPHHPLLKHAK
jgi:hypothetical protein